MFVVLAACRQNEHEWRRPSLPIAVDVVLKYEEAVERSGEGVVLWLYPASGGRPLRFDLAGDGGELMVPEGKYRLVAYSMVNGLSMRGTTHLDHELYLDTHIYEYCLAPPPDEVVGVPFEPLVAAAPPLWATRLDELVVRRTSISYANGDTVRYDAEHRLVLPLHNVSGYYSYEVRDVADYERVIAMRATLSGLAEGYNVWHDKSGARLVTIPFASFSNGRGRIKGDMLNFGYDLSRNVRHILSLRLYLDDATQRTRLYDVTEQVRMTTTPRRVHIVQDYKETMPISQSD